MSECDNCNRLEEQLDAVEDQNVTALAFEVVDLRGKLAAAEKRVGELEVFLKETSEDAKVALADNERLEKQRDAAEAALGHLAQAVTDWLTRAKYRDGEDAYDRMKAILNSSPAKQARERWEKMRAVVGAARELRDFGFDKPSGAHVRALREALAALGAAGEGE